MRAHVVGSFGGHCGLGIVAYDDGPGMSYSMYGVARDVNNSRIRFILRSRDEARMGWCVGGCTRGCSAGRYRWLQLQDRVCTYYCTLQLSGCSSGAGKVLAWGRLVLLHSLYVLYCTGLHCTGSLLYWISTALSYLQTTLYYLGYIACATGPTGPSSLLHAVPPGNLGPCSRGTLGSSGPSISSPGLSRVSCLYGL